jgi:MoaA/NifB/PqqE/SkfB family radical SAM enzyme
MPVWRRWLTPEIKEKLLNSLMLRLWYRRQMNKGKDFRLSIELTTRCNANCEMCTRRELVKCGGLEVGEMKTETVKLVLEEIRKLNKLGKKVVVAPMGLGEPLLYGKLPEFFKRVKVISGDIKLVLVTNGILLNKNWVKILVDLGVDEICVSLNAADRDSYKKIMGNDNYEKVIENIRSLIAYRNKKSQSKTAVIVQYLDFGFGKENRDKKIEEWNKIMKYNDKCFVHELSTRPGFIKGKAESGSVVFPVLSLWEG